jgi:hypothetical protein
MFWPIFRLHFPFSTALVHNESLAKLGKSGDKSSHSKLEPFPAAKRQTVETKSAGGIADRKIEDRNMAMQINLDFIFLSQIFLSVFFILVDGKWAKGWVKGKWEKRKCRFV